MALLRIPEEGATLRAQDAIAGRLAADAGVVYERWEPSHPLPASASPAEILEAYAAEIQRLKEQGGYATADVIDVGPQTPGLDAMLARFNREHWHDEDEVRFIVEGQGLFHIRPRTGPVLAIEVEPGDLIQVPRGTWHWFDLCETRRIRAIRLFQDPAGWTPRYTESRAEQGFEPVCLGPQQLAGRGAPR